MLQKRNKIINNNRNIQINIRIIEKGKGTRFDNNFVGKFSFKKGEKRHATLRTLRGMNERTHIKMIRAEQSSLCFETMNLLIFFLSPNNFFKRIDRVFTRGIRLLNLLRRFDRVSWKARFQKMAASFEIWKFMEQHIVEDLGRTIIGWMGVAIGERVKRKDSGEI